MKPRTWLIAILFAALPVTASPYKVLIPDTTSKYYTFGLPYGKIRLNMGRSSIPQLHFILHGETLQIDLSSLEIFDRIDLLSGTIARDDSVSGAIARDGTVSGSFYVLFNCRATPDEGVVSVRIVDLEVQSIDISECDDL